MLSSDINDPAPLTPLHFIAGSRLAAPDDFSHCDSRATQSWAELNKFRRLLWIRFCKEIAPDLALRGKWWTRCPEIKVDDIVIIFDVATRMSANGDWPLGRVVEVRYGQDGLVRTIEVEHRGTIYTRHIKSIMPLI